MAKQTWTDPTPHEITLEDSPISLAIHRVKVSKDKTRDYWYCSAGAKGVLLGFFEGPDDQFELEFIKNWLEYMVNEMKNTDLTIMWSKYKDKITIVRMNNQKCVLIENDIQEVRDWGIGLVHYKYSDDMVRAARSEVSGIPKREKNVKIVERRRDKRTHYPPAPKVRNPDNIYEGSEDKKKQTLDEHDKKVIAQEMHNKLHMKEEVPSNFADYNPSANIENTLLHIANDAKKKEAEQKGKEKKANKPANPEPIPVGQMPSKKKKAYNKKKAEQKEAARNNMPVEDTASEREKILPEPEKVVLPNADIDVKPAQTTKVKEEKEKNPIKFTANTVSSSKKKASKKLNSIKESMGDVKVDHFYHMVANALAIMTKDEVMEMIKPYFGEMAEYTVLEDALNTATKKGKAYVYEYETDGLITKQGFKTKLTRFIKG